MNVSRPPAHDALRDRGPWRDVRALVDELELVMHRSTSGSRAHLASELGRLGASCITLAGALVSVVEAGGD